MECDGAVRSSVEAPSGLLSATLVVCRVGVLESNDTLRSSVEDAGTLMLFRALLRGIMRV